MLESFPAFEIEWGAMSPVGAKLFGYNLAIGGNMDFPYTFFFFFG